MLLDVLLLVIGLVVIVKSADYLITYSVSLATRLNIPIFIVGIVIVAFGTSTPELIIGIMSGVSKANQLSLGNIIGSGFANIALILGLSAVIFPLKTEKSVVRVDIPVLIGIELLIFGLLIFDDTLSRIDGVILILGFMAFMTYITIKTKREQGTLIEVETGEDGATIKQHGWAKIIIMLILSIAGLFVGGKLTVDYSSKIALSLGLTETFIGITVVAIATTLPELVASITAVRKRQTEIVLGNCMGSNIFNMLLILGSSATINPIPFDSALIPDFGLLIALTVITLLIAALRKKISRVAGAILLSGYGLYLAYKILSITVFKGFFVFN